MSRTVSSHGTGTGQKKTFNLTPSLSIIRRGKIKTCGSLLSVSSKQQQQQQQPVMWSSSFCLAGLKQMGYLESTSFALVEKGQKGNENPLTVQHWMSLISQFTLCFTASASTILLCIFKSNCHLPHQHSADSGLQSGAGKKKKSLVKIDTQAHIMLHWWSEITCGDWMCSQSMKTRCEH